MDTNIIKEYLVGLGFKINSDSLNSAKQSIQGVEGTIKGFANSNMENMSSMQSFFKLFNSSIKDNLGIVSKILPEAKLPLLQVVSFAEILYKVIGKVSKNFKNIKSDKLKETGKTTKKASDMMQEFAKKTEEAKPPMIQLIELVKELNSNIDRLSRNMEKVRFANIPVDMPKPTSNKNLMQTPSGAPKALGQTASAMAKVSKESGNASTALQTLNGTGGKAVEDFATTSMKFLKPVAVGFAALVIAAISAWKIITGLGKQDLGYQKLATQLWTTTENAKEVSMALKTMKVSMQDLWLSPELLQQFNQLRKDSAQLKLPDDAEDKLKLVRSVTFEFQRLKQAGALTFQLIGYYIAKYCAGPLANIHEALNKMVNGLLKNIPGAAKVIGTVLGLALRLILTAIETVSTVTHPILELISLIASGLSKLPGPLQNIIKLVVLLGIAMKLGPLGIILLLLLALDDLFTYMKGGHSVIGKFFDSFKSGAKVIDDIQQKFRGLKDGLLSPIHAIEGGWNSFWGGIENFIDRIEKKFKKLENEIKNSALGKALGKIHDAIPDVKSKVQGFESSLKKGTSNVFSYIMPQTTNNKNSTSNTTHNSNQTNNFNIYGTDANSTATAVTNKLGVSTRNLQGVID